MLISVCNRLNVGLAWNLVHLAQSTIKSILTVASYVAIVLGLVNVSTPQTLWDVLSVSSVVRWVDLLLLAPPLRVDLRVQTS